MDRIGAPPALERSMGPREKRLDGAGHGYEVYTWLLLGCRGYVSMTGP